MQLVNRTFSCWGVRIIYIVTITINKCPFLYTIKLFKKYIISANLRYVKQNASYKTNIKMLFNVDQTNTITE